MRTCTLRKPLISKRQNAQLFPNFHVFCAELIVEYAPLHYTTLDWEMSHSAINTDFAMVSTLIF